MSFFQNSGLQLFESRSVLNRKLEPVGFKRSKIGSEEQFRFRRSIPRGLVEWVNERIQHTLLNFVPGSSNRLYSTARLHEITGADDNKTCPVIAAVPGKEEAGNLLPSHP